MFTRFPADRIGITRYFEKAHQAVDNAGRVSGIANKYAYAIFDCEVKKVSKASDYGYFVETTFKLDGQTWVVGNGHFASKPSLKVGQKLKMGDKIGIYGSTGKSSAIHDHIRIHIDGKRVDPLKHLYAYPDQFVHSADVKKVKHFPTKVKVLVGNLNIRSGPSTSATRVKYANKNQTYPFHEYVKSGDYYWVRIGKDEWLATQKNWTEFI